jgi:hypothetical protein
MRYLILALLLVAACSGDKKPDVVPEDRTFKFTIDNDVEVFDGIAPSAAAVATEKRVIESIIRSLEVKK